jgi:hypothetical protein
MKKNQNDKSQPLLSGGTHEMVEGSGQFNEMEPTCGECGQEFADPTNIFCMYCGRPREKLLSGVKRPKTTNKTNQSLGDETFNMSEANDSGGGGDYGNDYGNAGAGGVGGGNGGYGGGYAPAPAPAPAVAPMYQPMPTAVEAVDYSRDRTASALVDAGELEFEVQLAEGSTAIVWKGQFQGAPAALKKVKYSAPSRVPGEDVKEDEEMKKEAYLMTMLRHPNIVQFFALSFHEGSLVLVMELMKCSFRDLIDQNPPALTLQVKGKILLDTCLGLKYLHSRKPIVIHRYCMLLHSTLHYCTLPCTTAPYPALLHYCTLLFSLITRINSLCRDLKSMNVLIDEGMSAKLTDFGISRAKQSAAQALTSFSGTVAWMAPELLSAQATYTESVDVYALAMVFFEALTLGTLRYCSPLYCTLLHSTILY